MKSFITFLIETSLSGKQRDYLTRIVFPKKTQPPRITFSSESGKNNPIDTAARLHNRKKVSISIPDVFGHDSTDYSPYYQSPKHKLSAHIFDPNNTTVPGTLHLGSFNVGTEIPKKKKKPYVRIIPFESTKIDPHPDLVRHLDEHGYVIHNFEEGLAIKKGETRNPVRIGKILGKTKQEHPGEWNAPMFRSARSQFKKGDEDRFPTRDSELEKEKQYKERLEKHKTWSSASRHFERSREFFSTTKDYEIMISKDPYHIAEQSTNKKTWESCLTLPDAEIGTHGGCNHNKLKQDILGGTHVAYLIKRGSYDPIKPLQASARLTLRQYDGVREDTGETHSVLRPAGMVYGYDEEHPVADAFRAAVQKFTETHFPMHPSSPEYHVEKSIPSGRKLEPFIPSEEERKAFPDTWGPESSSGTDIVRSIRIWGKDHPDPDDTPPYSYPIPGTWHGYTKDELYTDRKTSQRLYNPNYSPKNPKPLKGGL